MKRKKKKKTKKKTLKDVIKKSALPPYVRFILHESLKLPGDYDPRQLDVTECGQRRYENNSIGWHSESVAMASDVGEM